MYLTISQQDTINFLAMHFVLREKEVYQYQVNIDNYTLMIAALPQGDVPSEIAQYVGTKPDNHTKIDDLPMEYTDEQIDLVTKYQYRVNLKLLLRAEKAEQSKSKAVLETLKAQIPADQLDALVADAMAKINAQTPSA